MSRMAARVQAKSTASHCRRPPALSPLSIAATPPTPKDTTHATTGETVRYHCQGPPPVSAVPLWRGFQPERGERLDCPRHWPAACHLRHRPVAGCGAKRKDRLAAS